MFQYISSVVKILSPVICFLFLFTSLNLPSIASQLHKLEQGNPSQKGSRGGGASGSKAEKMGSSFSELNHQWGNTRKNQIDSNHIAPETLESISGYSSGGGSSSKHPHRIQILPSPHRNECPGGVGSVLVQKTGRVRAGTHALSGPAIGFDLPKDPAVLILTLYWPDNDGDIQQDIDDN